MSIAAVPANRGNGLSELTVDVLGVEVNVQAAGAGEPLVVLHRDTGRTWSPLHDALAQDWRVIAPALPGFHPSGRTEWTRNCTELAIQTGHVLDALELAATPIVGLGFGGWIAAELAVARPELVASLVLHAPMGLRPAEGHYLDQFLIAAREYMAFGFASEERFQAVYGAEQDDDTARNWDNDRETITRLAWSPYLYNPGLPHMLPSIRVPTTVVRSQDDRVVPSAVAVAYQELIRDASLYVVPGGHRAEFEAAAELAEVVSRHLALPAGVTGR